MKRMKLLFTLALPVFLCQNIQAQTLSRLTAQANWSNNGAAFLPVDSSNYTYNSNARGGDLKHTLKYDVGYNWTFAGDTAYMFQWQTTNLFDVNNNDSVTIVSQWNGTTWTPYSATLNFYVGGLLQSSVYQTYSGGWVTQYRDLYSYNSANLLQTDEYETWSGASYTGQSTRTYYYDGSNNLLNETDASLTSGTPVYTDEYNYTYSSTNQKLTSTYSTWNGSAWVNSTLTTNTYDSTGDMTSQEYQTWDATNLVWDNVTLAEFSNFVSSMVNMPMTEIVEQWNPVGSGTWDPTTKYSYTYNSYGQMTNLVGISYNSSISGWEFAAGNPMANYYYGPYSSVSAVNNVTAVNGDAKVYPVPTHDMLHIDINWPIAQTATINMFDIQGNSVYQMETGLGTSFNYGIPVGNLAPGNYFIKISGQLGSIEKQIVVSH